MPLMWDICEHIRNKFGDEPAIQVNYEDQPINDFKSLFMVRPGPAHSPGAALTALPPRTAAARPHPGHQELPAGLLQRVRHQQRHVLLPAVLPGSLRRPRLLCHRHALVRSAHPPPAAPRASCPLLLTRPCRLTQKPCNLSDALHHTISNDAEAKAAYAKQAAADWECILLQRAKEMRPGARAVIVNFAVDENGYYLGNTDVKHSMWANMDRIWKAMGEEGRITPEVRPPPPRPSLSLPARSPLRAAPGRRSRAPRSSTTTALRRSSGRPSTTSPRPVRPPLPPSAEWQHSPDPWG